MNTLKFIAWTLSPEKAVCCTYILDIWIVNICTQLDQFNWELMETVKLLQHFNVDKLCVTMSFSFDSIVFEHVRIHWEKEENGSILHFFSSFTSHSSGYYRASCNCDIYWIKISTSFIICIFFFKKKQRHLSLIS